MTPPEPTKNDWPPSLSSAGWAEATEKLARRPRHSMSNNELSRSLFAARHNPLIHHYHKIKLVPAKTPNSMDVKIGETHAIVQYLLWCPDVWGKSSKISCCCCCRFDVLLFLFVLCRHAHCEVARRIH